MRKFPVVSSCKKGLSIPLITLLILVCTCFTLNSCFLAPEMYKIINYVPYDFFLVSFILWLNIPNSTNKSLLIHIKMEFSLFGGRALDGLQSFCCLFCLSLLCIFYIVMFLFICNFLLACLSVIISCTNCY